jgi:hypothetical protein
MSTFDSGRRKALRAAVALAALRPRRSRSSSAPLKTGQATMRVLAWLSAYNLRRRRKGGVSLLRTPERRDRLWLLCFCRLITNLFNTYELVPGAWCARRE